MSIEVNEIVPQQQAEYTRAGWSMVRVWKVKLEEHLWGPVEAVNAVRTQAAEIGDAHPLVNWLFLNKLTPSEAGDRLVWDVRGEYGRTQIDATENPLEAPKEVTWSSATYTEPVSEDIDGNAVVNSAGQPFDPPLTQERHPIVATVVYNSESYDPNLALEYQDSVNDADADIGNLRNVPARMAKVLEIGAVKQYWEEIEYWQVTIKIEINTTQWTGGQGWDRRILDQGIYEKDGDDTLRMKTDEGEEVTEPLKLNGSGAKLEPQTADPVFLTYKTFKEKDFSQLNLEVT